MDACQHQRKARRARTRTPSLNGAIGGWAEQNSPAFRAAEIPSVNGMTDARSLARLYAACVSPVDGCRTLDAATITEATKPASEGPDAVIFTPTRYGLGFGLPTPPPRCWDHPHSGTPEWAGHLASPTQSTVSGSATS